MVLSEDPRDVSMSLSSRSTAFRHEGPFSRITLPPWISAPRGRTEHGIPSGLASPHERDLCIYMSASL